MNPVSDKDLKPCAMIMQIAENVEIHKICPECPEFPELDQIVCHANPGYFNSVNMGRMMTHCLIDKDL